MKPHIAVLDDEPRMVAILEMLLRREGYQVTTFQRPEAFLESLETSRPDLLLTDLKMPGMDGLDVLTATLTRCEELPVILLTAHATVRTAIQAMRSGAFDYLEKPFENEALLACIRRALKVTALSRENRYLRAELRSRYSLDDAVVASPAMREVLELARRAARSKATVLISGESGTGKEVVARAVHYNSDRVGAPFVAVNCKAFAAGVLESELFGHEKGAFTGAATARTGIFERAQGGTLLLDEIGEIDLDFQAKLLRVLQTKELLPVGGTRSRPFDVRVIAATNRNLKEEVEKGAFREDLYFRLAVIPLRIPPLRERREDIRPLAAHFLRQFSTELGRRLTGWSPEVDAFFLQHPWPGNVRELENTLERAVVLARGDEIVLEDLLLDSSSHAVSSGGKDLSLQAFLDRATAEHLRFVLKEAGGRKLEAARLLGIERTTLYRLLRRLGLEEGEGSEGGRG